MNDKQIRFLIQCIAAAGASGIYTKERLEASINETFDRLGEIDNTENQFKPIKTDPCEDPYECRMYKGITDGSEEIYSYADICDILNTQHRTIKRLTSAQNKYVVGLQNSLEEQLEYRKEVQETLQKTYGHYSNMQKTLGHDEYANKVYRNLLKVLKDICEDLRIDLK